MSNFILVRALRYTGKKMDGYKTYAGAIGKACAGIGTLATGALGLLGHAFPDQGLPVMETETALGLISAGVYATSSALSSAGIGHKIEKAANGRAG